jgi:hypothetical protein
MQALETRMVTVTCADGVEACALCPMEPSGRSAYVIGGGALIGYVIGDQIFNDASVGLGFGVVVGAGVGSLVGIIANS